MNKKEYDKNTMKNVQNLYCFNISWNILSAKQKVIMIMDYEKQFCKLYVNRLRKRYFDREE